MRFIFLLLLMPALSFAHPETHCGLVVGVGENCDLDANNVCEHSSITMSKGGESVTFDNAGVDFYSGRHADGSPWISAKTTLSLSMSSTYNFSVDANPSNPAVQAVLNANNGWGTYSAAQDVSLSPWTPTLPITSLVAGVQLNEAVHGAPGTSSGTGRAMGAVFVLTVYDQLPGDNFGKDRIRPHITGDTKTTYTINDFTFPTDSRFSATQAEIDAIAGRWLYSTEVMRQTDNGEVSWAMRSHLAFSDTYGTGVTKQYSGDLAFLMGALPPIDSSKAWAAMMAYGGDTYKAGYADQTTDCNGGAGQSLGVCALSSHLFAALLNDDTALNFLAAMPSKPGQDFSQINKVSAGHPAVWGDPLPNHEIQYLGSMQARGCFATSNIACNNNGKKVARDPYGYIDGPPAGSGKAYMVVTGGQYRAIAGAMMAIPRFCTAYNKPEIIEYANRISVHGALALPDPVAPPDAREPTSCNALNNPLDCNHYSLGDEVLDITWGPDPYNPGQYIQNNSVCTNTGTELQCVSNCAASQNGRFPSLDGNPINYTRTSPQWETNFNALLASNTCN